MAITDPNDIDGLRLWYTPDAGVTQVGQSITVMANQSTDPLGGVNDLTPVSTSPLMKTEGGGVNVVVFDGDTDVLAASVKFGSPNATNRTYCMVLKTPESAGTMFVAHAGDDQGTLDPMLTFSHDGNDLIVGNHDGTSESTFAIAADTWCYVVIQFYDAANYMAVRVDGAEEAVNGSIELGRGEGPTLGAGYSSFGTEANFAPFRMRDLAVYNGVLVTTELADIETYLAAQIPIGGPDPEGTPGQFFITGGGAGPRVI